MRKDIINTLTKAILAGGAISLGGIANICSQNKIVGSLFFTIGLFLVLACDLNLFTGKVCYIFNYNRKNRLMLICIYIGNLIGALICGYLLGRVYNSKFTFDIANKLNTDSINILIKAFFCNILIYIAVNGYKTLDKEWKKILSLFFGVSVFVLCGFEHCIADMFYISYTDAWSGESILFIAIVTIGNIFGGILIPLIKDNLYYVNEKL